MCFYCNCELIVQNNKGDILRNAERTFITTQFGNIDFTLRQSDFVSFYNFLNSLSIEDLSKMTNHHNNKVVIRQKSFMGGYSFYPEEFNEFRQLVGEAVGVIKLEEEIKKLLQPQEN